MSVAKLNVNELTGLSSITERVGRKRVYYDILSGNEKIVLIICKIFANKATPAIEKARVTSR